MKEGRVHQLNVKPRMDGQRGLPKFPAPSIQVTTAGVEDDYNKYRQEKLAGDPDSALLLMPLETLESLNQEGWSVRAGDLGENVTTIGLAYEQFQPGTRWRMGECEVRIARPCDPCRNLYLLSYVGTAKGPEFLKTMKGRRGWYAAVERAGTIRVGDSIVRLAPEPSPPRTA